MSEGASLSQVVRAARRCPRWSWTAFRLVYGLYHRLALIYPEAPAWPVSWEPIDKSSLRPDCSYHHPHLPERNAVVLSISTLIMNQPPLSALSVCIHWASQ
jgi:hypothetical protein